MGPIRQRRGLDRVLLRRLASIDRRDRRDAVRRRHGPPRSSLPAQTQLHLAAAAPLAVRARSSLLLISRTVSGATSQSRFPARIHSVSGSVKEAFSLLCLLIDQ